MKALIQYKIRILIYFEIFVSKEARVDDMGRWFNGISKWNIFLLNENLVLEEVNQLEDLNQILDQVYLSIRGPY